MHFVSILMQGLAPVSRQMASERTEDVKDESEVISSVLQEDNGNTPQDVKREKRNVISSDDQVSQSIYFSLRLYLMV